MSSAAGPPSSLPLADVTVRMAIFARLFGEHAAAGDPAEAPDARGVVEIVRARVPRTTQPAEDAGPVFEAAAFVGEWLRARTMAVWVAEGPYEPHLQVIDGTSSIVYLLPLVSVIRVASTAGYDGLSSLLDGVLQDVSSPPARVPLAAIRVRPATDAPRVAAWLARYRHIREGQARAALWRRCQSCSTLVEDAVNLYDDESPWETVASAGAAMLAKREFGCACGGPPGEVSRFLLLRASGRREPPRFADILLGGTHTRIACWLVDGDEVEPQDATSIATGVER
jgi:hypothetical protein